MLADSDVSYGTSSAPGITVNADSLDISSSAGVRHIHYLVDGETVTHDEHLGQTAPTMVTVPLGHLRSRLAGASSVDISVIDNDGNIAGRDRIALPSAP